MKKLLMFLCCVFALNGAFAAKNCNYISNLSGRKNLNIGSMEALEIATNQGFVCDANIGENDTCPYGSVILKVNDAGSDVTPMHEPGVWKCNNENGAEDHWRQNVNVKDCDSWEQVYKTLEQRKFVGGKYLLRNNVWEEVHGAYKYKTVFEHSRRNDLDLMPDYLCVVNNNEMRKCLEAQKTDKRVNIVKTESGWDCNCGDTSEWNRERGRCERKVISEPTPPKTPGKPTPSTPSYPVTPPVNTPVQPATPYVYSCPNIDIDAGNCATAKVAIDELKQYCANDTTRDFNGYNTRVANINNLIAECDKKNNQAAAASLTMRIRQLNTKIAGKLDGWHKNLNVWKTAEGDFNTARLASDSIAGVVLGTAGGLITSHVVKKGQIKNGFEDINCAIGGQNVAGWHDEFTVGIK